MELAEKMKVNPSATLLPLFICFCMACELGADTALLRKDGEPPQKLNANSTDYVRENLIHIFDSSQFHHMKGGALSARDPAEIREQKERVESASYIELTLDDPAPIFVERKKLKIQKLWVSIREADGFVYDWILKQPDGTLVALGKPRGELIVQFAPYVLHLLNEESGQDDDGNG